MARTNIFTKLTTAAFVAAALTATSAFAVEETSWGTLKVKAVEGTVSNGSVAFSFGDLMPAAKLTAEEEADVKFVNSQIWLDQNRSKTKAIGSAGGQIVVGHKTLNHGRYTLRAEFHVPAGALDSTVPITMTLVGDRLQDMVVEFAPAGLEFDPNARLILKVGKKRAPLNLIGMVAEHIFGDGQIEQALWEYTEATQGFMINIAVPGFSRYSMGGGA